VVRGPYLQTATPTSVIVKWRTDIATDSAIRYGTDPANLDSIVSDVSDVTDHELALTGLSPDTNYYYAVGTVGTPLAGDASYVLTTPPVAGSAKPTRVWFLGDSGTADASAAAVRNGFDEYAGSRNADLMVMLGDNAYRSGTDSEYQDAVFDMYPEHLRQMPLWPTMGNHDAIDIIFNPPGAYYSLFTLPTSGEAGGVASGSELYYSFDYGDIHFICLDSQLSDRAAAGAQMIWLENDLAANDKFWTVVYWHHPAYSKGSHDSDAEGILIEMRENAVPLLEEYGVDLVLAGHSHSYERSFLLNGHHDVSTTLTAAMLLDDGDGREGGDGAYTKAGAAGTSDEGAVYVVAGSSGKLEAAPLDHPAMYSSLLTLGSVVMDVSGNRMELAFINDSGNVADYFTMVKSSDSFAPGLVEANSKSFIRTDVVFSEDVTAATANTLSNYVIDGITVTDAVLQPDGRTVRLMFGELLPPETSFDVVATNVEDQSGNTVGVYNDKTFTTGEPTPGDVDGDGNIDWWDIANLLGAVDTDAIAPNDPADMNNDGRITVEDAHAVWAICELPQCAPINNP